MLSGKETLTQQAEIMKQISRLVSALLLRQYLQNIQKYLNRDDYTVELYHGKLPSEARQEVVGNFQDLYSKDDGLPTTLKSGGQDLVLISANHAVMMTPSWNTAAEARAQDRQE